MRGPSSTPASRSRRSTRRCCRTTRPRQAAEDLEQFRQYLGADKIQLYGESYGTQLVQTYAAAHPDRIAGLFLDGPVDLSHSLMDYYQEQTKGFAEALEGHPARLLHPAGLHPAMSLARTP